MGKKSCWKLLCLILLTLPILSGCSKSASNEDDSLFGIDGYVYTVQQINANGMSADKFKVMNGYVYYRFAGTALRRFPIEEWVSVGELSMEDRSSAEAADSKEQLRLPAAESLPKAGSRTGYILDYTVDEEGSLCYLGEELAGSFVLIKQHDDGSEEYAVSLTGSPRSLAMDSESRAYVLMEDSVYIFDGKGQRLDQLSVSGGDYGELLEGEAGTVYYYDSYTPYRGVSKIVADGQSGSFRLDQLKGPRESGVFSGSRQGLFFSGGGMLYRYGEEAGSWETVLRWGDSNLACNSNFTVLRLSENRLAVSFNVYGQSGLWEQAYYLLTKTPVGDLPEKQVLVMEAGEMLYDKLEQFVMEFNRDSEEYHITIRHTDPARLDAELVSSNPPDLINLTAMDYAKYGQKDVLEDLMPYLEGSALLGREDFRASLLEACTVKGRLVCIPDEISCTVAVGRASQLGSGIGWTAADAMAFAESYPQARLFINNSFSAMIREFFRDYILGQFIDWESGECYFDGEEFIAFIKWTAEHSDGVDSEGMPREVLSGNMPGERLLDIMAVVNLPWDLLAEKVYFGEEITVVGYPTAGGEAMYHGTGFNQLGIVAASDKKEGAWHFIESFLGREDGNYIFLPSRRDRLEEMVTQFADERMDFILPDGTYESFDRIPEEELEQFYTVIDEADFAPRDGIREEIINIIVEEMSPCLSGAREYEDAADIVQNRVRNMVQE